MVLTASLFALGIIRRTSTCQQQFGAADAVWHAVFERLLGAQEFLSPGAGVSLLFLEMCFGEEPKAPVCATVADIQGKVAPYMGNPMHPRGLAGGAVCCFLSRQLLRSGFSF